MTDKQIIIDGCDVSGCVCFSNWHVVMTGQGLVINEIENACTTKQKPCTDIKDCIFKKLAKQLKAKEQECEELKREIDIRSCANIERSLEFKKYKKAIDEIEEIADNNYENPEMERIFKIIGGLDV